MIDEKNNLKQMYYIIKTPKKSVIPRQKNRKLMLKLLGIAILPSVPQEQVKLF